MPASSFWSVLAACTLGILAPGAFLSAQSPNARAAGETPPFWIGTEMTDDPLFFIQQPGEPAATAKLLFPADTNPRVTSMDGAQVYEANRDYIWQPGSDTVTLTPTSRIPFKTRAQMYPPAGVPQSFATANNGKEGVLFGDGAFFYDLQSLASYHHSSKWGGTVPAGPSPYLSRTQAKLAQQQPVKVVVLGDSISAGYSSSSANHLPPNRPDYADRLAVNLRARFGSPITVTNLSVPGRAAAWGPSMVDKVIAEKPDLVLLAFGMNDGENGTEFVASLEQVIKPVQAAFPNVDFILVSTMTGNPDIASFPARHFVEYRDALLKIQSPGMAVADITSVWIDLLKQKTYADLTGNGVNHPNDFGQEVYANVIEALF